MTVFCLNNTEQNMKAREKIKQLRELNYWSQEELAEKANISPSNYAKIERGEIRLTLDRLEQFAEIFDIDITKLIQTDGDFYYQINDTENSNNILNGNYCSTSEINDIKYQAEIKQLKQALALKDKLLTQQEREISTLTTLLEALKLHNKEK